MLRVVGLALCVLLMLDICTAEQSAGAYKKIVAFEVRPGVLMLPKFAPDGRVCKVAIEKLHYRDGGLVDLDTGLSRVEIASILSELAPGADLKKLSGNGPGAYMRQSGVGLVTTIEFDDFVVKIYGLVSKAGRTRERDLTEVVVVARWKGRKCAGD